MSTIFIAFLKCTRKRLIKTDDMIHPDRIFGACAKINNRPIEIGDCIKIREGHKARRNQVRMVKPIYICLGVIILLFKSLGDLTTWVIALRQKMQKTSNGMYMSASAIVDPLFLYIRIIPQIVHFLRGDREITNAIICRVYFICVMYVDYLSAWLRFCFTMERTVSVTLSYIYRVHFTRRITLIILVAASLILAAVSAIFILMSSDGICNMKVYAYIFSWIDLVLSTILPFTGIIVNNSIMIYSLCKARRQRRVFS